MLGNPVDKTGRIQAQNEVWKGTPTFRVTSTFAQHVASGRGPGIDFGNGRQGDAVYAMAAGKVVLAGFIGSAKVVRLIHAALATSFGGAEVGSGYAHLSTINVALGQVVTKGQQLGAVGMTGADAPHLHGGFTVNGVERDFWPLLDQNTGDDMTTTISQVLFLGTDGKPADRNVSLAAGPHTGYKPDGSKKPYTLASGSSAPARSEAIITQVPDKDPHGPGWLEITAGVWSGYYLRKGTGVTPEPDPPIGGDTAKAKKEGAAEAAKVAAQYAASLP
jgi:murein DD-endopeptidase MepM/ murein hydrolase activator NlpD